MSFVELFRDWEDTIDFQRQDVIFSQGDSADVMYVILSGEVELSFHKESLGTETRGDIIGEMAIIESAHCNSTATALSDVSLARINHDQFTRLIDGNAEFSLHVMAVLANRLRAVDNYISTHLELKE
jgi:CRP/FNR family cyclic AMP-dependent transcriptional regulator